MCRVALRKLPQNLREIVVLREFEDLSYQEISEVVGVPVGTVMSRLSRAREQLKALLIENEEGGAAMKCEETRELLDAVHDGELQPATHAAVRRICAPVSLAPHPYRTRVSARKGAIAWPHAGAPDACRQDPQVVRRGG